MDGPLPNGLVERWEKFLERDRSFDELFKDNFVFPLQRRREMERMLKVAACIKPKVVMEIGTDKGGGLWAWLQLPTVEQLIGIEIRGLPYISAFQRAFPKKRILPIAASSYEAVTFQHVKEMLEGKPIDVLFLDGDKSWFDLDFDTYLPLMNPNGIVFSHDAQDPAPGKAFAKIRSRYKNWTTIIDTSESVEMLFKQPKNAYEQWLKYWNGSSCGVGVICLGNSAE